jgi:hypothetical protein
VDGSSRGAGVVETAADVPDGVGEDAGQCVQRHVGGAETPQHVRDVPYHQVVVRLRHGDVGKVGDHRLGDGASDAVPGQGHVDNIRPRHRLDLPSQARHTRVEPHPGHHSRDRLPVTKPPSSPIIRPPTRDRTKTTTSTSRAQKSGSGPR